MQLDDAKKIILITNMGDGEQSLDIKSSIPHDNNWINLGDDYFRSINNGVAGPSIGDPTRTFVSRENYPFCPVCGIMVYPGDLSFGCKCSLADIEEHYGWGEHGDPEFSFAYSEADE